MRPKGSPEELERRRRWAVRLLEQGECPSDISRILGVARSSLYRWKKMAQGGPQGLDSRPIRGRPRSMSPLDHRRLEFLLMAGATAHGWANDLWTARRVRQVILRHFGIRYHVEHVRHILTNRLGWSCQRPQILARERDEEAIERWKRKDFPRIKKGLAAGARR